MCKLFYPYEYVDSVFAIDYQKLYDLGYRGILFDIDNTLVPHGKGSTPEVDALFARIHKIGLKTIIVSNNSETRIQSFLENIDSEYIYDAKKPQVEGYLRAIDQLGITKDQAVYIGDQVFTDVLGANRVGIASILVKFIRKKNEKKLGIRRRVEMVILFCYKCRRSCQHRLGNIQCMEDESYVREAKETVL